MDDNTIQDIINRSRGCEPVSLPVAYFNTINRNERMYSEEAKKIIVEELKELISKDLCKPIAVIDTIPGCTHLLSGNIDIKKVDVKSMDLGVSKYPIEKQPLLSEASIEDLKIKQNLVDLITMDIGETMNELFSDAAKKNIEWSEDK